MGTSGPTKSVLINMYINVFYAGLYSKQYSETITKSPDYTGALILQRVSLCNSSHCDIILCHEL